MKTDTSSWRWHCLIRRRFESWIGARVTIATIFIRSKCQIRRRDVLSSAGQRSDITCPLSELLLRRVQWRHERGVLDGWNGRLRRGARSGWSIRGSGGGGEDEFALWSGFRLPERRATSTLQGGRRPLSWQLDRSIRGPSVPGSKQNLLRVLRQQPEVPKRTLRNLQLRPGNFLCRHFRGYRSESVVWSNRVLAHPRPEHGNRRDAGQYRGSG